VTIVASPLPATERQLTSAAHGHVLTNINVWSPDSRWIVYDVRSLDSVFDGTRIEQVNVETGAVQVLYESKNGAACGVVTYHPREPKVIFIHGPENPSPDWTYGASRRRGAIVEVRQPGEARPLDAMNYAPPFTPGALRGGSHVHVFSPDSAWVSFTYEDEVLARLGPTGEHDLNQRTIGASMPAGRGGVRVARGHPRNHDGDYFTVVVARTVSRPRPGSDEINRAFEEGWVIGRDGRRALAFLGNVTAPDGREHAEVFLAELPADLTRADEAPLEGTATRRPAPPLGVTQRRLTRTSERKFPGVALAPRHWLRASPDGAQIAFLMKDNAGVVQLWTIAPAGGEPRQVTRNATGIASAFTWSPDGTRVAHVMDNSVFVTGVASGGGTRLTPRTADAAAPLPLACVFSPDGRQVAFLRNVSRKDATFSQIFTVSVPPP
jgi:dipeptidyl aminopeptidase/acylaminoacyl peptidase